MLTKQKRAFLWLGFTAAAVGLIAGCSPSGPQALLDGKRLLERGHPKAAVQRLRMATDLLPTNTMAWAYLGVAYHQAGSISNAVAAYQQALALNPDMVETRFNLGCLWREQGEWAQAQDEFASVTVLDPDRAQAWLRLGEAQVHNRQHSAALRSFSQALHLNANDPDFWNWLGVAQVELARPREAANSFRQALRLRANHGPALLNLAVIAQQQLGEPQQALKLYRQYLAFLPNAPNRDEVTRVAQQLETRLAEPSRSVSPPGEVTEAARPETPTQSDVPPKQTQSRTQEKPVAKPARPKPLLPVSAPPTHPVANVTPRADTVVVKPEPKIVAAQEPVLTRHQPAAPDTEPLPQGSEVEAAGPPPPPKRGFFARINPLNLFKTHSPKKQTTPLPEPHGGAVSNEGVLKTESSSDRKHASPAPTVAEQVLVQGHFAHYRYRIKAAPKEGNRGAAERLLQQAEQLNEDGKTNEAIRVYSQAVRADPAFFQAQFNLGLACLRTGDLSRALTAYETATRIRPESTAARYNFALVLKSAGYPVEAANESLKILAQNPADVRAHLMLGNLYDQQFGDKADARKHYQKVIELSPGHPEAGPIRFWLAENPL